MKFAWWTLLVGSILAFSWLGMQIVHEAGHVIVAWLTGGEIARVVLHPLAFSRTDLFYNPRPMLVVWAGPVFGALGPLLPVALARLLRWRHWVLARFFAGFCLVANGVYIGVGAWMAGRSDPGVMASLGSPVWALMAFSVAATAAGFYLWHTMGCRFGLAAVEQRGPRPLALVSMTLLAIVVVAELIWSGTR